MILDEDLTEFEKAGNLAYLLFAIGVIGTGFIAIPVLCGSISYIITETFGWDQGLDKKFHEAKEFYVIIGISLILGLSLNYIGITPIQSLIYTAILYGLTAPVLIAIILPIFLLLLTMVISLLVLLGMKIFWVFNSTQKKVTVLVCSSLKIF